MIAALLILLAVLAFVVAIGVGVLAFVSGRAYRAQPNTATRVVSVVITSALGLLALIFAAVGVILMGLA